MNKYVKTFKVENGDKDMNNDLISFCIDDDNILEKHKTMYTRIEDIKYIQLKVLPVCKGRYIKASVRTYGDKVHTNFHSVNVPEDGE